MNRQPLSGARAWAMHMVLAFFVCLWQGMAHSSSVSFTTNLVVTAAIVLLGGLITTVRANGALRDGRERVVKVQAQEAARKAELDRLVFAIPALHYAFAYLHPQEAYRMGRLNMHQFSLWLMRVLEKPDANVMDWIMQRSNERGKSPQLQGVFDEVPKDRLGVVFNYVNMQARGILAEMWLMVHPTPANDGATTTHQGEARRMKQGHDAQEAQHAA